MTLAVIVSGAVAVLVWAGLWAAVLALVVRLLLRWRRGPARSRIRAWWTLGGVALALLMSLAFLAPASGSSSSHVTGQTHLIQKP